MNSGAPEGCAVPAPHILFVLFVFLHKVVPYIICLYEFHSGCVFSPFGFNDPKDCLRYLFFRL